MADTLPFSEEKQLALIGHLFIDTKFFQKAINYINSDWFIHPLVSRIFNALRAFYKEFNRHPTPEEISGGNYFDKEEEASKKQILEFIKDSNNKTKLFGLDVLRTEIDSWFALVLAKATLMKARDEWNSGNVDKIWDILNIGYIKKVSSSFESGSAPTFSPAHERAAIEREERIDQSLDIKAYGIKYLDDALGGIIPNDLIVLGAKSGFGKTQCAASIARYSALNGFNVHFFALEAENNEVERRIKFSILSDLFYQNTPREKWPPNGSINYLDWRMGRLEALLLPFEKESNNIIKKDLKTLNTLYRTSGEFGLEVLDKHLSSVSQDSDLIILDHLHYIDTDGENENHAHKNIIKKIRDSCLKSNVPVIVVAHLRKDSGGNSKSKVLVNHIEDFHGSSDITKIATTCIMLSPAYGERKNDEHLWPTYLKTSKTRLESVRTRYTAVVDFNIRNGLYESPYRLGMLKSMDTEWEELSSDKLPFWASKLGKEE